MRVRIDGKSFGAKPVLGPVSFDVEAGSTVALLGRSGIGKTTLLRIVAGLDAEYAGSVSVPACIGIVFQEPRLLPWYPAIRNVELAGDLGRERAASLLERVGLADAACLYPRQLSLGMARRVSLARALAVEPELLILDEPFASLDEASAAMMRELTGDMAGSGKSAVLLVTHDPEEAASLASRVLVLAGSPATLTANIAIAEPLRSRGPSFVRSIAQEIRGHLTTGVLTDTEPVE